MRRALTALLLLAPATALAAERKLFLSSFERLRVDGPFRVTVTTGRSPAGVVTGDPHRLDGVEVRQEGATVYVRRDAARADEPRGDEPVTVALATPALAAVNVIGPGAVSVAGMKARRIDLSVSGTGSIAVAGADAAELHATTVGTGRIAVAGRTGRARLLVNGAGGVDAAKLDAGEITVRLDGPGEVAARARFTAAVTNGGLGRITVAGPAKCRVAAGGGPVTCEGGIGR